jgi:hypothetical protein
MTRADVDDVDRRSCWVRSSRHNARISASNPPTMCEACSQKDNRRRRTSFDDSRLGLGYIRRSLKKNRSRGLNGMVELI